jgi:hypothetical protein
MATAAAVALLSWGCMRTHGVATGDYFPLTAQSTWIYQVTSKSQRSRYVVIDRVIGEQYVPALKLTGIVVDELWNLDRGGTRSMVYYAKDGYMTRLSGLDYDHHNILAPPWGRSEDARFIPTPLVPNTSWSSTDSPYGRMPGGFKLTQIHRTFAEQRAITVGAGDFRDCIRVETETLYQGGPYAKSKSRVKLLYADWYAANVGLVKSVARENTMEGAEVERVELIRFNTAAKR